MKNVVKLMKMLLVTAALYTVFVCQAYAEPVNMTLTYDGAKHSYNAESIELQVNGETVNLPLMPPVILNSRTYVPSREVFEPMGATVDWKDASKELYIAYDGTLIVLKASSPKATVNGREMDMDTPPKIINDKLMIPVRFVAEALSIPVEWDGGARIVSVGVKPEQIVVVEPPPAEQPTPAESAAPVVSQPSAENSTGSVDISPSPLTEAQGDEVNITNVTASGSTYTINASGAISKVEKTLLPENKLVLDIYNATNALSGTFTYDGFSGVSAVRNSQFQSEPENITRVVFDFVGANRYSVSFGADRKSINVEFEPNSITDVSFATVGVDDQITVKSNNGAIIKTTRLYSPDRLAFDIPQAVSGVAFSDLPVTGRFVSKISVSQLDPSTVRITADLTEPASSAVQTVGTDTFIIISGQSLNNVRYSQNPSAITLVGMQHINASLIAHYDDYLNKIYRLTLPGNHSNQIGYGKMEINDGLLNSITIQTNSLGNTEIVINEKSILAYTVENVGEDIVIRPRNPKEVYKTIVYVDAGHGGNDPGATAGGFQEKNLNLNIALKLYQLLDNDSDIKVYASRLDDSRPDNASRARTANEIADLFVSIHHNSISKSSTSGTEVLYLNHAGEVYPEISSEAVARIFQTNLVAAMGTKDRGVVKRADLIVLNTTTIPAVLVEVGFLTNSSDLAKVSTEEGRQIAANAMYKAIKEVFAQYPTRR